MTKIVRSKFVIDEIAQTRYGNALRASPVYGNSPENAAFFQATPSGNFEVGCTNPGVLDGLKAGDEIFIDIQKAE